ncbi:MAG: M28 family peptidase [Tannerella sp.]|jgi:Zn-dependent M28 family amino/carboxypeptidase|nr:M28 family peptidase [Tannerella sp.]
MDKMIYLLTGCLFLVCCGQKTVTEKWVATAPATESYGLTPAFNQDSAYTYVERQVQFGPRVPNTEAHKACAQYLASELDRFGAKIYIQETVLTAYNGDRLQASNIIGSFNPEQTKRVLLFAHWDSRPYSDQDPDAGNHRKPIDGADDGASGVGVLLEIARQISLNPIDKGIDIIFFDAEDYGTPVFLNENSYNTFCLGSQFWAKNPHVPNYKAEYGILLDMVGSKNATFYKEGYSVQYAAPIVEKVWSTARNLGYGKFFIQASHPRITDDHQYVNELRNIPSIDIINLNPATDHGFGSYWHTQQDKMDLIDRETLKAVGQTVLEVIYKK